MKTRITELLKIRYPIIQGAMYPVSASASLVAAVSEGGGLGIVEAAKMTPDELRKTIRGIKEKTEKPCGINLIPEAEHLEELLDTMIAEQVPVFSYGIGNPKHIIDKAKEAGLITIPTVGSVRHAVKAERDGAEAIIVQGTEAGGHASFVSTMVLVPLVVERVKIPVVAAGGIGDARGLVAAFALGADGISMGTRFIATKESPAHPRAKQKLLESCEEDTIVTRSVTGVRARAIKNKLTEAYLDSSSTNDRRGLLKGVSKISAAYCDGDVENGSVAAGQVCGLIDDIPTCHELMERIINGAIPVLEDVKGKTS